MWSASARQARSFQKDISRLNSELVRLHPWVVRGVRIVPGDVSHVRVVVSDDFPSTSPTKDICAVRDVRRRLEEVCRRHKVKTDRLAIEFVGTSADSVGMSGPDTTRLQSRERFLIGFRIYTWPTNTRM